MPARVHFWILRGLPEYRVGRFQEPGLKIDADPGFYPPVIFLDLSLLPLSAIGGDNGMRKLTAPNRES